MKDSAVTPTFVLPAVLAGPLAWAGDETPIGRWRQIDDATGEAKSVVRVYADDGVLEGKIVKFLKKPEPGESRQPVCDQCKGELKRHSYLGFPLLSGLRRDGDEWTGGAIIDPESGKQYSVKLALSDDGQKLEVRGYLGLSLCEPTQVWERIGTVRVR
jgi:uncharacterized protein (DUF2147 family)